LNNKFRVLVAEDEPIICRNIVKKIEGGDEHFEVVDYAYNGKEALQLARSRKPDVLVVDIRMPLLDGLELIKKVREFLPQVETLVISGHDEFSYAQTAIQLGVHDYILKPVNTETLRQVLGKLRIRLERNRYQHEKELLGALIRGEMETIGLGNTLGGSTRFAVLLANLGNLRHWHYEFSECIPCLVAKDFWDPARWSLEFKAVAPWIEKLWILDGSCANQRLFLLTCSDPASRWDQDLARFLLHKLQRKAVPFPVTVCCSNSSVEVHALQRHVQFLSATLERGLIPGRSQSFSEISASPAAGGRSPYPGNSDLDSELTHIIRAGDKTTLKGEFDRLYSFWEKENFSQREVEAQLLHLLRLFIKENTINLSKDNYHEVEKSILKALAETWSPKSLRQKLWAIFERLLIEVIPPRHPGDLAEIIDRYIRSRFVEPLTIDDISNDLHYSSSYLSKVFKKYHGKSPIQHIIELRVQEAKRLLEENPSIEIQNVAEIVGYLDPHYFTRLFKKLTGCSPTEFKRNHGYSSGDGVQVN
jgi:YesN/AraC family two-component response regulator